MAARSLVITETVEEAKVHLWVRLSRGVQVVQRRIVEELARMEVTLPQFDVLATLRYGERLTQQELAQRLLVTKGNVCGVLDRLEKVGWVERRPDPVDGRANRVYLTAAGRRKVEAVLPVHDRLVLRVMREVSAAEVKVVGAVMVRLEGAAGEG